MLEGQTMAARSIWTGSLGFGLVTIPVKLVTAVRDKSIHFNLLSKDGSSRLRRKLYAPDTGKEYEYGETSRGYEIAPDRYVIVTEEEIEKLRPEKTRRSSSARSIRSTSTRPTTSPPTRAGRARTRCWRTP
jgi:DNA end-binding protein Ku